MQLWSAGQALHQLLAVLVGGVCCKLTYSSSHPQEDVVEQRAVTANLKTTTTLH